MESLGNANNCQLNSNGSRLMNNNANQQGNNTNGQNNSNNELRHTYTIAGIIQYLQYEWQRFELHRQQWEVEKTELQARIALLQGERKGQENLKIDLIRRIKMLEFCLKQERAKFHKFKFGVDPPEQNESPEEVNDINFELDENLNNLDQKNWKQGRQLLRHYLQEIGYTDTIIDVRSNRVRSLLGLSNQNEEVTNQQQQQQSQPAPKQNQFQTKRKKDYDPSNMMAYESESSVLATFEFLHNQNDEESNDVEDEDIDGSLGPIETEEVLNEFDMILNNNRIELNEHDMKWKPQNVRKDIDLGELASLTETENIADTTNTSTNNSTELRKTWSQKYILKSHYDCIRALRFHGTEPLLITASDDETLKLWNINKTQLTKSKQPINTGNAALDLEPIYTYRGHTSRVLSLCVNGNVFYSGSQNGELISWSIPSNVMNLDIYDPYDYRLQINNMKTAHNNAIWSLATLKSPSSDTQILCSASADCKIKIWDANRSVCLKSIESEEKTPTDLAVIGPSTSLNTSVSSSPLLLCTFDDGSMELYDVEAHSSNPVMSFEKVSNGGSIYSVAVHPIMPIVITAHQSRLIKLWDITNGKCIHSMVAHLDEVTSVDLSMDGWYILSGSHDCSVRLWNFDNKNCVQEMTSHRKKFDEAIFDVTFHPTKPYFASAGADGLAKVFV